MTTVHPGKQLVVGGYAFLPGDLFPRVSLAMDAIIAELVKQRKARARDSGAILAQILRHSCALL